MIWLKNDKTKTKVVLICVFIWGKTETEISRRRPLITPRQLTRGEHAGSLSSLETLYRNSRVCESPKMMKKKKIVKTITYFLGFEL